MCRRGCHIEDSRCDMERMRDVVAKAMSKDREHGWCVEYENDTNMRTMGAEGFLVGTSGWKVENSMKNESVGNTNEDQVQDNSHYGHSKAIPDIDGDVSTPICSQYVCEMISVLQKGRHITRKTTSKMVLKF